MPTNKKGDRRERELVNRLDDAGFAVMRAPASGGATQRELPDVLAGNGEAFVDRITDDLPEKPSSYETIITINAGERSVETEEDAAELETGPNSCAA